MTSAISSARRGQRSGRLCDPPSAGLRRGRVESTDIRGLADHVAFHRLQQLVSRRRRRQIQFGIERVELEDVVMKWSRTGTRAEIGPRIATTGVDARSVAR